MSNFIVDDIGSVVAAMRPFGTVNPTLTPYYMYGHRLEIAARLSEKDKDSVYKYQKYPLVALRLDTPEVEHDGVIDYNLNIVIVEFTKKNYNAEERYVNVIKPILYPLYNLFIKKLIESGLFMWGPGLKTPPHTKIDRPYWGTAGPEGNIKSIFNDELDGIELMNLKISREINKC